MICARVVSNNDPRDVEVDGVMLHDIRSITPDPDTGDIVLIGRDIGLDTIELRAPFGRTIEIYH